MFTSPVPPTGLRVCRAVTGGTNNALTALSNLSHVPVQHAVLSAEVLSPRGHKWRLSQPGDVE